MDDAETYDSDATGIDTPESEQTAFSPEEESDDIFFAVVQAEFLREALAVHQQTDGNAVCLVREGIGVKIRGRSYYCYWFEAEIPAESFEMFAPTVADFWIDPDQADEGLSDTQSQTVALRGKPDGHLVLETPTGSYDLYTDDLPYMGPDSDDEDGPRFPEEPRSERMNTRDREPGLRNGLLANTLTFTIDSTSLQALTDIDADHDHLGVTVDGVSPTAKWFFFNSGDSSRTVAITIDTDDFQEVPSEVTDSENDVEKVETLLCRQSLEAATSPMRGPVQVWASSSEYKPTWIRYERGGSAVSVYGYLGWMTEAKDTFQRLLDDS